MLWSVLLSWLRKNHFQKYRWLTTNLTWMVSNTKRLGRYNTMWKRSYLIFTNQDKGSWIRRKCIWRIRKEKLRRNKMKEPLWRLSKITRSKAKEIFSSSLKMRKLIIKMEYLKDSMMLIASQSLLAITMPLIPSCHKIMKICSMHHPEGTHSAFIVLIQIWNSSPFLRFPLQ